MSKKTRSTSARRLRRRKRSKILRLLGLPSTYRPPKPSTNGNGNGKHAKNGKHSNGRNGKHKHGKHEGHGKHAKPNRDLKPQFKPQAKPPLPVSSVVSKPKSNSQKSQPPLSLFDSAKPSTESVSPKPDQKPDLIPVRSHSRSNKVANYKRQKPPSLLQDERKLVSDLGLVGQAISRRWKTPEHVLERLVPLVWRLARQSEDEKVRLSAADVLRKLVESDRKADVDQITLLLKKRELENAERVDDANRPKAVEIVVENRDQANQMMGWDEFQDRRISIDSVTEDGESDTPEAESRRLETILGMLDEDREGE